MSVTRVLLTIKLSIRSFDENPFHTYALFLLVC